MERSQQPDAARACEPQSEDSGATDDSARRREPSEAAKDGPPIDQRRRRVLVAATSIAGGAFALAAASPFVASLMPSERARAAGAPVEADVSGVEPGEMKTVIWREQPVWLLRRTPRMLAALEGHDAQLVDPLSRTDQQPPYCRNATRSIKPAVFVAVGLCTHLGCSPHLHTPDGRSQPTEFYCPCHGSRFDLAGRVYKDVPAPKNLLVPPHRYLSDSRVLVGDDRSHG